MKWTTTTALILAAGGGALWVSGRFAPEREDPRALLARLETEGYAGAADQREALRRLTNAIDARDGLTDPALATALLKMRAAVYRSLGALGSAREDIERVLSTWAPGDRDLDLEAADLMALDGQTEEALLRVRALVDAAEPSDLRAQRVFELLGRLEASLAEQRRARAIERSVKSLDERGGLRAKAIITEASARGAGDPRTAELLSELRAIFRGHDSAPITEVLDLVARSGEASLAALRAFARSTQFGPTPLAVTEVAHLLEAVGMEDEAADLMLAARTEPVIERSPVAVGTTLRLLERTGRMKRARPIAGSWNWSSGGDLEFYRSAAERMFRAGMHSAVSNFARGMRELGGARGGHWTNFYYPASTIHSLENSVAVDPNFEVPEAQLRDRVRLLTSFARNKIEEEPYPGARVDAWFIVATGERLLGNDEGERSSLVTGLTAWPSAGADHWLRLAELESRAAVPAWEQIEARYTVALDQEPRRTAELLDRWLAAGDRALASDGLDLPELIAEARVAPLGKPLRRLGPSVLWRIAESHLSSGRIQEARHLTEDVLRSYPRLVPALDTLIEAQLKYSAPSIVAESILRRIELVGGDDRTDAFLARLPEPLSGASLMRAMRAAPERLGRSTAALLARQDGDTARAAELLDPLDAGALSPTLLQLRAGVRVEAGRYAAAGEDFAALLADPVEGPRALVGAIDVSLRSGTEGQTDALVQRAARTLTSPLRLEVVEDLMRHGRVDLAQQLLGQLDQTIEARTPAFYSTLVRCAVLTGDTGATEEAIARAEPYSQGGVTQIAELLLHIRDRNWLELPGVVARLRATGVALTAFEDACLTLLEERLAQGRRLTERSTAAQPRSAEWALLHALALALEGEPLVLPAWYGASAAAESTEVLLGNRRGRRDPRELLAVLLLLERPAWHAWVEHELRLLREQRAGGLWPTWLDATLQARRGAAELARARIDELLTAHPSFGPAWDRRLAYVAGEHTSDPLAAPLLKARIARLNALGEATLEDTVEIAVARASVEALRGADAKAVGELGRTLTRERRGDFDARYMLGALLARAGQPGLAVEHLREAAASAPPEAAAAIASALVDALLRAADPGFAQRSPIPPSELPAQLESVVRLFPTDPIVACEWVRHGVDRALGPSQRASGARLALTRLRRESGQQSLESMRRGSTRAWVDLTLEVAPELARELVDAELVLRPGDVDLWDLSASIADQFGDRAKAEELYRMVLAIEQRASASYALAGLMVRRGAPAAEVQVVLSAADRAQGGPRTARARTLVTQLRMRETNPNFQLVASELEPLWQQRDTPDGSIELSQVGFALVATYLQWADDLERQRGAIQARPATDATPRPELPTEAELAEKALATLLELEPFVGTQPQPKALFECYRGVALNVQRGPSSP